MHGMADLVLPMAAAVMALAGAAAGPAAGAAPPGYTLAKRDGAWWLVTPEGTPFVSRGVCCVETGIAWRERDPANPGYGAWQHYPDLRAWATDTAARLRAWGFTTAGGWSDYAGLKRDPDAGLAFTPVLHMGATSGAPWLDMWDPKVIERTREVAREGMKETRGDRRLLGYYSDNEMGWWNAPLFSMALEQPATSGQRQRLIALLREHYGGDWKRLLSDFEPEGARGFASLARRGKLYLRPGADGIRLVKRFVSLLADRYYSLCRGILRKEDPRGLFLGDRYQGFYYPEVARAAGRYVDVVSTNRNAEWNDGVLARFFLDTLHALSGRPVAIGEFYMTATENRSGNRNTSANFPVVRDQEERARGFLTTARTLASLRYVVAADWFQYYDEPTHGRGDGENYNMGLVDIHNVPYEEITAASASLDARRLHGAPSAPRRDVRGGVPPAPPNPLAFPRAKEGMRSWDRERGFVPCADRRPLADLYLCWDEEAVYAGLCAMDPPEDGFYRDKRIPQADRTLWTLTPGGRGPAVRVRLGGGPAPATSGPAVTVVDMSGGGMAVERIAAVRLPAALFGRQRLRAGERIVLRSEWTSFARAYGASWSGAFVLAGR